MNAEAGGLRPGRRRESTPADRALEREREALAYSARLHWFHWLILLLSAVLTIGAWQFAVAQVEEKRRLRFEREASQIVELVSDRMEKYEVALLSGVATVYSLGGEVNYDQWKAFAGSLHIETKYPGINGIGVVDYVRKQDKEEYLARQRRFRADFSIHPPLESDFYFPIRLIEPEAPNLRAVGLDLAHEQHRLEGALKARDTGKSQITAPIVLVQDEGNTPGFLFHTPFYSKPSPPSLEERRQYFHGTVYAPFIVRKLIAGTLDKDKRLVGITLSDGQETIYDENRAGEPDYDPDPVFSTTSSVEMYGRDWLFDIHSTWSFREATRSGQPQLILLGGIVLDTLLLTLFLALTRSNRRALRFADRVAAALQTQAQSLAQSNSDLESFAYVASHDLRTPLRGMGDLIEFLEEDLEAYLNQPDADPGVKHNLGRLDKQLARLDRLVGAILEYSSIGSSTEKPEEADLSEIVDRLRSAAGVRPDQLVLDSDVDRFVTYRIRFEQVVGNLVRNAFQYHDDLESAVVTLRCREAVDWLEFSVIDNGPGIESKYHHRIFEAFQTLQSKDEIDSTGVGLSIVKRTVEALGGVVTIESARGKGSTFSFLWPKIHSSPQ